MLIGGYRNNCIPWLWWQSSPRRILTFELSRISTIVIMNMRQLVCGGKHVIHLKSNRCFRSRAFFICVSIIQFSYSRVYKQLFIIKIENKLNLSCWQITFCVNILYLLIGCSVNMFINIFPCWDLEQKRGRQWFKGGDEYLTNRKHIFQTLNTIWWMVEETLQT